MNWLKISLKLVLDGFRNVEIGVIRGIKIHPDFSYNSVNKRLSGDITEDPEHLKIQFPDESHCQRCHTGKFGKNETEVFQFLVKHYTGFELSNTQILEKSEIPESPKIPKTLKNL